jgi:PST family polysaccharide transporter
MWTSIATAIILPVGFFFGSRWGTNGIAAAWIVVYPPIMLPIFYKCFQCIEMKAREYVSSVTPALASSVIMVAAVLIARLIVPQGWSLPLRLSILVVLGALIYAGALFALYREHVGRIVRAVRSIKAEAK